MSSVMIIVAIVLFGMSLSSFIVVMLVMRSSQISRLEEEWLELASEKIKINSDGSLSSSSSVNISNSFIFES